jgi:hypothetical protein
MEEIVPVDAVIREKTHIGEVDFPVTVPDGLLDWLDFPRDILTYAGPMGLGKREVKFLLGALRGKLGLSAVMDLPDVASKTGIGYAEMDGIVRGLIAKNYARFDEKLDLYRLWIVLLHLKGVRFQASSR